MIEVLRSLKQWQSLRQKDSQKTLGFVPTMGALHEGHISLCKKSREENELTLVSIFVNPTQFNNPEDLAKYPKTFEQDLDMLSRAGVDYLIYPDFAQLYPDQYRYRISENQISEILCGAHRPGHFDGVLTVVMKLLQIAQADRAYFGEKDYQQYLLVKEMAQAFFLKTEIVPCAIVREADGLAMSSRNVRLSTEQRELAPRFYQILKSAKDPSDTYIQLLAAGFKIDYIEERWGRRLGAVHLGDVRLIDNVTL